MGSSEVWAHQTKALPIRGRERVISHDSWQCSGCFRLEQFAGCALYPRETAAFSRRTPIMADIRPGVGR
jgi:hypothetical protein